MSYHEHNRAAAGQAILARLLGGETCALVTDAGTPAISDPGEDLVRLCSENGVTVQAVPGCCAAVCALAVSGLPTGRFTFEGFLSANRKERRTRLQELAGEERTMVFHEAPHKLRATLGDMAELLGGERPVALCRELTKLHEQTMRTTLAAAVEHYRETEPRGGVCPRRGGRAAAGKARRHARERRAAGAAPARGGRALEGRRPRSRRRHGPEQKRALQRRIALGKRIIAANEGTPRYIAGRSLAVEKGPTEFAPRTARINLNYFSDDMRVRKNSLRGENVFLPACGRQNARFERI